MLPDIANLHITKALDTIVYSRPTVVTLKDIKFAEKSPIEVCRSVDVVVYLKK